MAIQNCTFAGNSALSGGAIAGSGTLTIRNSTISRNSATRGGGIAGTQTLRLQNTILSGNTATSAPDLSGSITTDLGYNLLGTSVYPGKAPPRDLVSNAPGLAPLGNYGGPTPTMPPVPGSGALATGNPLAGGLPAADQRGFARINGGRLDIGAVQTQVRPFLVTTAADPGDLWGRLSLREAVNLANAWAAAGTGIIITFAPGLAGATITLTQGLLELSGHPTVGSATIEVNGGRVIAISGNGASSVLQVDAGVGAIVTGLAITHGDSTGSGGGIVNKGLLIVQNCTLSGNVAEQDGGAIYNTGVLTVQNGTLSANSATGNGGAIATAGGTVTIQSSTIAANTASNGGGIAVSGGLTLQNSIVVANMASSAGTDIFGTITDDAGNNLLGTALKTNTSPSSDVFTDTPGLAALGNYSSFLQTMGLLPGSAALGAGTWHNAPSTDERGVGRRHDSRWRVVVDIGAFEGTVLLLRTRRG